MASPLLSRGRKHRYSIPAQSSQILPKTRPRVLGRRPLYPIRDTRYHRPWDHRNDLYLRALRGGGVGSREGDHTSQGLREKPQQADGSVFIPDVLRPYMSGIERISAAAKGL